MSEADDERAALIAAMARVAAGDREAFAEVYRRTSAKLFGIVLRILVDRAEAEDSLQDVYATIWTRAGRYDPAMSSPITWAATIARNRAIDRLRARRQVGAAPPEAAEQIADPSEDALAGLIRQEAAGALAACMEELDARTSAVIRRAFFTGLSYPELAAEQAVPLGTVKSWIRRGMIRLRACLER